MVALSGSMIVADDIRREASGKLIVVGVYINDISIATEPWYAPLAVLFNIEAPHPHHPYSIEIEVTLPGEPPRRWNYPLTWPDLPPNFSYEERPKWSLKVPFYLGIATLRQGPITGSVTADGETTSFAPLWIQLQPPPPNP